MHKIITAAALALVFAFGTATITASVLRNRTAVSVNPSTDVAYVANRGDNTVSVIDGKTNNVTTVK